MQEEKVDMRNALDAGLVITKSSGTKSDKQDTSSKSGTYITHVVDADIRLVNDQVPFVEVQLIAQHNVLANKQQHTEQSEPIYDTCLLEKVDRNTTPYSTNMSHRGGKIDQDVKQYQDAPEFHEFFKINDLKDQLQAKTTLICNLKNQIKGVKEASNEAKVKIDIDVIETINIELEHSVAKLLATNEKLHKENEHLKQTYNELYDSIKKTRVQNKDNNVRIDKSDDLIKINILSTDTLRLLTNEQKAFRDNLHKSGVGYNGSCVLSQAYAKIPKLYRASGLCDKNEQLHVFDFEETLEDAKKIN
ncbi:hypothetical protein Tco_0718442 [Tanacetum coccineum]